MFFKLPGLEVHLHIGPEVVVEHASTFVIPPWVDRGVAAAQQASHMVVSPNVKDEILGTMLGPLLTEHTPIGLIHAVTAHPKIPDGLAEVSRQIFLPGLAVANLVAEGEAVAIGVDA